MKLIELRVTKKYGRGIYAAKNLRKGTIVEVSPLVLFNNHDIKYGKETILNHYWFEFDEKHYCLALGYGSLFNHHPKPNTSSEIDMKMKTITFVVEKDIKKGQQLFIDYGYQL